MPPHLSDDLKEHIIQWNYIDWMTMEEICDLPKCSIGLVYNIIYNYGDFSEVHKNPFIHCAAAPLNLSFLKEMIEANKSLYLDETQQNVRKVEVSVTTNS